MPPWELRCQFSGPLSSPAPRRALRGSRACCGGVSRGLPGPLQRSCSSFSMWGRLHTDSEFRFTASKQMQTGEKQTEGPYRAVEGGSPRLGPATGQAAPSVRPADCLSAEQDLNVSLSKGRSTNTFDKGAEKHGCKKWGPISTEPLTQGRRIWLNPAEPNEHGVGGLPSFPFWRQTCVIWKDELPAKTAPSRRALSSLLTLWRQENNCSGPGGHSRTHRTGVSPKQVTRTASPDSQPLAWRLCWTMLFLDPVPCLRDNNGWVTQGLTPRTSSPRHHKQGQSLKEEERSRGGARTPKPSTWRMPAPPPREHRPPRPLPEAGGAPPATDSSCSRATPAARSPCLQCHQSFLFCVLDPVQGSRGSCGLGRTAGTSRAGGCSHSGRGPRPPGREHTPISRGPQGHASPCSQTAGRQICTSMYKVLEFSPGCHRVYGA
ncbi:hypothetical protein HPG69_012519 [Diceros bicornis minor]|uniref:Uncharacterized protein n=1 Tax=Diceros bicornis minor TaxID=77932 RepID=A0A7J7F998_DICBM|nr:hypothetical protein HPG69_012519 [Diceros bicornis minor]